MIWIGDLCLPNLSLNCSQQTKKKTGFQLLSISLNVLKVREDFLKMIVTAEELLVESGLRERRIGNPIPSKIYRVWACCTLNLLEGQALSQISSV
ncbi:hypothetical protein AVEN_28874-1 [Araneus ventricosus]|uniref:Uncharacterized protein n=1 Tax=Araneus ventricosus TaxID=182803 RepID=A0A4Y2AKL6_ARAVE|nr:hypothetical protein AVEN_28874-1 [Araneus ventricosus]